MITPIDYAVVRGDFACQQEFVAMVQGLMEKGWELRGPAALSGGFMLQTMVRYDRDALATAALRQALEAHHQHAMESTKVYFEQDGKPIDVVTDLGEAYSESELCQQTAAALHRSRP